MGETETVTVTEVEASRPDGMVAAAGQLTGKVAQLDTTIADQRRQLDAPHC